MLILFLLLNFAYATNDKGLVKVYTSANVLNNSVYFDIECNDSSMVYNPVYRVWGFPNDNFGFVYHTEDRSYDYFRVGFVDSLGNRISTNFLCILISLLMINFLISKSTSMNKEQNDSQWLANRMKYLKMVKKISDIATWLFIIAWVVLFFYEPAIYVMVSLMFLIIVCNQVLTTSTIEFLDRGISAMSNALSSENNETTKDDIR